MTKIQSSEMRRKFLISLWGKLYSYGRKPISIPLYNLFKVNENKNFLCFNKCRKKLRLPFLLLEKI